MEWIDVKIETPNPGHAVICFNDVFQSFYLGKISVFYFPLGNKEEFVSCETGLLIHVTHWMELPEPPNFEV